MLRTATALLCALAMGVVALALAGEGAFGDDDGGASAGDGTGAYPGLRALDAIRSRQLESGTAVYPALVSTDGLEIPSQTAVESARAWARGRTGAVSFAIAGEGGQVAAGFDARRRFRSASLTKAMLLVAFLRTMDARGTTPTPDELASLGFMIRISDNESANAIYRRTGDGPMQLLALDAGMRDFAIAGNWAEATVTAADQARFFGAVDRLLPPRFVALGLGMLETVIPSHAWGIPAAARPAWRVFFKGGWRPGRDGGLVHQAAMLQNGGHQVAVAVLTEGNPDDAYGHATISGITRRLLAGSDLSTVPAEGTPPPAGELVPVVSLVGRK